VLQVVQFSFPERECPQNWRFLSHATRACYYPALHWKIWFRWVVIFSRCHQRRFDCSNLLYCWNIMLVMCIIYFFYLKFWYCIPIFYNSDHVLPISNHCLHWAI
jgi:hypothetical protein